MTISVPELLSALHDLADFDCGKPALNDWLRNYALSNQKYGFTRVLVVHENLKVLGFYGLAPSSVQPAMLSRSLRTGRPPDPVPCILLGQLAVDMRHARRGIGSSLLRDALLRCVAAAQAIGGRAVIVRAIDKAAEDYWRANGFVAAKNDPATLFCSVEAIAAWLQLIETGR